MYDAPKVILGIIVFLLLFTSPLWINIFGGQASVKPDIQLPDDSKECIYPTDFMKTNHMDLLNEWRDKVVRENQRFLVKNGKFVDFRGKKMEMSLSHTCMKCHNNKSQFCDQCHNYLKVNPYCWDCHVAPKEVKK